MQFDSLIEVFDSTEMTVEHPVSPEGTLFTYYPLDQPETLHYHNFLELGYSEYGSGLFYVDGDVIPFNGKTCSIIYGGQVHIAQSVETDRSLWHFLYVDLQKLFSGGDIPISGLKAFSPHLYEFPSLINMDEDPVLYSLITAILDEAAGARPDFLTSLRGLVTALLVRHSRYMNVSRQVATDRRQTINRLGGILTYINQNYAEELTVPELARLNGTSKSTFQRDMISFTGLAPLQYIHKLRMRRAVALLSTGDTPVSQIAFSLGYASLSSFNRHFRAEYGMSPTQWLKKH